MKLLWVAEENRKKIDLHGLTREEAIIKLEEVLDTVPQNIYALIVVHGYSLGSVLLDVVRNEITHPRIEEIVPDNNPGITIIKLKKTFKINLRKPIKRKYRKSKY